jgi:GTP pyrophosphokinase
VVTSRAKNKIRQALKEVEYRNAAEGRELLERRFKNWKLDYTEGDISRLALKLGYKMTSDLYQSIALGKEDLLHIKEVFQIMDEPHMDMRENTPYVPKTQQEALALEVDINVKSVEYNLATCCNPQPGDPIFAFISITKGVRIHHFNCPNAENMRQRYPYRMLPARWAKKKDSDNS